jgi:hypothetical protein
MMWTLLHRRDDGTFVIQRDGWPYHVTTDDALFPAVAAAAEGVDLPAEPQPEPPPPQPVTDVAFWQFMMAARRLGFVSMAEASAAVKQREMPAAFASALDHAVAAGAMTQEQRDEADITFAGITRMLRNHPLVTLVVAANIATDEQIDGVFAVAATIT